MQPEPARTPAALARAERLQRRIGQVEEGLAMALVAAMAVVVNLQVVARYLFDSPFIWCEEVTRLILVWLTFVASAALVRRGGDIAINTFVDMLPAAARRPFIAVRDGLMLLVFGFVAWEGWRLAGAVAGMPLVATEWPTALLAWPLVVGGVLTVFHVVVRRLRAAHGLGELRAVAAAPQPVAEGER